MPVKSKAQHRAMRAAATGKGYLGIPKKVAKEYIKETKSVKRLPERKKRKG